MAMTIRFDGGKVAVDMALKGWEVPDLAARAGVSIRTIYRFIGNEKQTPKTAKKIAAALGFSIRRYLIGIAQEQTVAAS